VSTEVTGSKLRIGVLGCADIAWRNSVPAMLRADAEVIAVASRDLVKAERFAGRFGAEPVRGYEPLLDRDDLDAVYVAVPTGLHHVWARRALEAGKHVLVEKPLTTTLAEAEDLVTTARKHGRRLMDNFVFLHHSQHAAVRRMTADGRIGEIRTFTAAFGIPPLPADDIRYRSDLGGGALLDLGVYGVKSAQYVLGADLDVAGAVLSTVPDGVDLGGSALLCSAAGVTAELTFSFRSSYRSTYSIWGSEGRISLGRAFTPPATHRPVVRVERQDSVEEITLPADDQFANIIRYFARSVQGGGDFETESAALLKQAALVDRIRDRARRITA
jgi:dTDP-3,4-didehydro-2,6-dideoxy-alpha-D-glucose 3-reductase